MSKFARPLVGAILASMTLCAAGCAIPAWFAAQLGPKKKVPAEYEPPKGKTILVLVDDMLNPVDYEPIKIDLTEMLNEQLLAHKVAAKTIPYTRIGEFIGATPGFNALATGEVGSKLGADMVLRVRIDDFGLRDPDASQELWKGRLQTNLRLVDVKAGRLWPTDRPLGHMVLPSAKTPTVVDDSPTRGEAISKALATETADRIAKYFYAHKTPYQGAYGDKSKGELAN